jgi:hypothetical protein
VGESVGGERSGKGKERRGEERRRGRGEKREKRERCNNINRTDVSVDKRIMTVLAPCPGQLPSKYLILGTLKWLE